MEGLCHMEGLPVPNLVTKFLRRYIVNMDGLIAK